MGYAEEIDRKYHRIYRKILRFHRFYYTEQIALHTIRFVAISLLVIFLFVGLNLLFEISNPVRWIFTGSLLLWFGFYSVYRIFPALREIFRPSPRGIYDTALRMGKAEEDVRDALVNYVQLYQDRASIGSAKLKNLALEQLAGRFEHISFQGRRRFKNVPARLRILVPGSVALFVLYLIFPQAVTVSLKKIIYPWKNFREPLPVRVYNQTGDRLVLKNDPVVLSGRYEGVKPEKLFLVLIDSLVEKGENNTPGREKIILPVSSNREFHYQLKHVRSPFRYYFEARLNQPRFRNRPAISEVGQILVRERPSVRNLQIKITPPSYTRLPVFLLPPNDGEISALMGSKVGVRIEADKQLSRAFILFSDSTHIPLKTVGHTATGEFTLKKNVNYTVHIFDSDSIGNDRPVEYSIYVLADEYPFAEIRQPGADVDLGDELSLPLFIEMHDDFGFSGLWLKGMVVRQGSSGDSTEFAFKLPYKILEKGKGYSETMWDLTPFYLVPDDYIQYYVEIRDNDRVSGPKSYRTGSYIIRLPSLLEVLEQAEQVQEDRLEDIKDIARESKELKKKLEEISREMKKEKELDWERKQEIKQQVEQQKKALEKLNEIQKELEDLAQKLDRNSMLSPETLEKFFELQKMMEELATPELKEAMKKLQEALEKADPRQVQKALERFQFSVEQFEKNIERTYELFKRIQLEQKMDELVKLAEKITREQEEVNKKLEEKISPQEMDQLQKKEENLQKETDYLREKIDETNREYEKLMQELSEMLKQAGSFMDKEQLSRMMEQMQQQMSRGEQQQASQSGKQLQSQLDKLQQMLRKARENMMQQQKQELAEEMRKAMQDMLNVSFQQEELLKRSSKTNPASSQVNTIARRQSRLQQSTRQLIDQLIDISHKTFFLSPQMNQIMASVMNNIDKSITQLEGRNPRRASQYQRRAMAGYNRAMLSLQNSMQRMAQASSASGFQEFMQQLQQMAGQQGQLNQETLSLFQQQGSQGRLQLSASDLARLAAQQEMIRQSLENLSEKMGNRRDVLGRLGELGQEMEEVVKQLKSQQLDRKVIERQERILSRLLDAQKSIREKEYSRKRIAEREKQVLAKSPPELRRNLLQKEDRLRKELMESLREGYSPEYREYIKRYFENLSRQPVNPE